MTLLLVLIITLAFAFMAIDGIVGKDWFRAIVSMIYIFVFWYGYFEGWFG